MATLVTYKASEVDIIRCLFCATQANLHLNISESAACQSSTLFPSPSLKTDEGTIFSSPAICQFFLANSKDSTALNPYLESKLSWIIFEADVNFCSSNKPKILNILQEIEHLISMLYGSFEEYSSPQNLNLFEIFMYSTLARPRFGKSYGKWPHINMFLNHISQHQTILETLKIYPMAKQYYASNNQLFHSFTWSSEPIEHLKRKSFFLTTAIIYTNGPPHIGHAYEYIISDFITRYHRQFNKDVFYLTGSDEHGQKIANNAAKLGLKPIEICDKYSSIVKVLHQGINSKYDRFIRTTESDHKKFCHWLWNKSKENGDIYLDKYEGWYNEREENFLTENDAKSMDYIDPTSGLPLVQMSEESYFFRMSKYQQRLIDHINSNPEFIQPDFRKNEVLSRLQEPLLDLSCSRTNVKWGISVPDNENHVIYVWFDALANYLSGIGFPDGNNAYYWDSAIHMIGKDISWFHCVIWPCILMSANIPLPKSILIHGFIAASDGRKMSKSIGNIIDPFDLVQKLPSDVIRYYLVKEIPFGGDLRFDDDSLIDANNSELADSLGNLVHRGTALCIKFSGGLVPKEDIVDFTEAPFDCAELSSRVYRHLVNIELDKVIEDIVQACHSTNKFITNLAPWVIKSPTKQNQVVRTILEAIYILAHYFEPIIPNAAQEIFNRLNSPKKSIPELSHWYDNLKPGTTISSGEILFKKLPQRIADIPLQKFEIRSAKITEVIDYSDCQQSEENRLMSDDTTNGSSENADCDPETKESEKNHKSKSKSDKGIMVKAILFMGEPLIELHLPSLVKLNLTKEELIDKYIPVVCNLKTKGKYKGNAECLLFKFNKDSFILPFSSPTEMKLNPTGSPVCTPSHPPIIKYRELPTPDEFQALKFTLSEGKLYYNNEPLKGGWNTESQISYGISSQKEDPTKDSSGSIGSQKPSQPKKRVISPILFY